MTCMEANLSLSTSGTWCSAIQTGGPLVLWVVDMRSVLEQSVVDICVFSGERELERCIGWIGLRGWISKLKI